MKFKPLWQYSWLYSPYSTFTFRCVYFVFWIFLTDLSLCLRYTIWSFFCSNIHLHLDCRLVALIQRHLLVLINNKLFNAIFRKIQLIGWWDNAYNVNDNVRREKLLCTKTWWSWWLMMIDHNHHDLHDDEHWSSHQFSSHGHRPLSPSGQRLR